MFGSADNSKLAAAVSAFVSAALLALNAYTKDSDPGLLAQEHKTIAARLWTVRESYLSLLTDVVSGAIGAEEARKGRDDLQEQLATI